jgi:hypothetical protein
MIEIYKEMYPNRHMTQQILKSSLVDRKIGIDWDKEIRGEDGIKGCYYNVIRKVENNNEDNNNYKFGKSPIDYGIESDDLNIVKLKNENSELKNKLKELEDQILQLSKKEEIKQVQINDDDIKALEKELNDVCKNIKPKKQEPKPEPEPENKFDNNDINDILEFIESSTNTKKSKKSKK